MALSTGFWAFKTLAAAHELDLFSRLAGGPGATAGELAQALGLHPRPAEMLLTGCAALGLLEKTGGRYHNTPLSEAYLVRGSGGAVVISELLVDDEKTGPAPDALMSLNMLIETEGRNYTPAEYSAWLREAGFRHIETV